MEQNQRVPARLSGTKLNDTWVNTAKAATDKSAPREPRGLRNAGALPKSSNGKEYAEPQMSENEDVRRDKLHPGCCSVPQLTPLFSLLYSQCCVYSEQTRTLHLRN